VDELTVSLHSQIEGAAAELAAMCPAWHEAPMELLVRIDTLCHQLDEHMCSNHDYMQLPIIERMMLFVAQDSATGQVYPVTSWDRDWHAPQVRYGSGIRDTGFVGADLLSQEARVSLPPTRYFSRLWWQHLPAAVAASGERSPWEALAGLPIELDGATHPRGEQPLIYASRPGPAAKTELARQLLGV
jgi:hypothetical protein